MNINEIGTPALLVDSGLLQQNLSRMATLARAHNKRLRPHFKAHKCLEVARRQIEAGAAGICAATDREAQVLVRGGIRNVLLTSPIADRLKARRVAALAQEDPGFTVVVDHPDQVDMYESAASSNLNVIVDLDVGDHRTGIQPGKPALDLTQVIINSRHLRFAGLQGYSVRASHAEFENRAQVSADSLQALEETRALIDSAGIPVPLTTGASTATALVDAETTALDELQAGSYVFMDLAYRRIGGMPFANAALVLATVISGNHSDRVTVDAGFKAFSTDRPFGPEVHDDARLRYTWAGDEFGYLLPDGNEIKLRIGDRVRFVPPHCDPTVNLYDLIYICEGDQVTDTWPVMERMPSSPLLMRTR
jgi:D-serine deaminase-like pyridoxal phosphate-dependent protein